MWNLRIRLLATLALLLSLASVSWSTEHLFKGPDPGLADTVRVDSVGVYYPDPAIVPITFYNDEELVALELTVCTNTPAVTVDSFSFVGGRVESVGYKGFALDISGAITAFAYISDEEPIPPGQGLLGNLWLSYPDTLQGTVEIDSTTVTIDLIERSTSFTDTTLNSFKPQFVKGYLDLLGSCCQGIRGNADMSPDNVIDIGDLTLIIEILFINMTDEFPCLEEANVDGSPDQIVDISDLTRLIGYLFIDAASNMPADCP